MWTSTQLSDLPEKINEELIRLHDLLKSDDQFLVKHAVEKMNQIYLIYFGGFISVSNQQSSRAVWINEFTNGLGDYHFKSKEEADEYCNRVAVRQVKFVEVDDE